MIGKLNHVAIAVPSVSDASNQYKNILGAKVSKPIDLPDHGVKTVFIELDNTKIELLEPIGDNSPIEKFLKKNPSGGMHHICYEVQDIKEACSKMKDEGATILGLISLHPHLSFWNTLL